MARSRDELRRQLGDVEPDERTYRDIGPDDVPALTELMDDEPWLAARAVHALSRIDSDDARRSIVRAADSSRMEVRVAAAAVSKVLPADTSDTILAKLLQDTSAGVRKFALRSVGSGNGRAVRDAVAVVSRTDTNGRLRQMADQVLESM
jgi:HEAT repeat protein